MQSIYTILTPSLQNLLCTYYGYRSKRIRFSKNFYKYLEQLHESQYWSETQIVEYQNEKIRDLMNYVYTYVPYYTELFKKLKLHPTYFKTVDDLQKLPVMSKETVRDNQDRLLSTEFRKMSLQKSTTGGTTGSKLEIYRPYSAVSYQWAVWWRHRNRYGIHPGDKHANFTTKNVAPTTQKKPPFWRWSYLQNQLLIGMNQITTAKTPAIIEYIDKQKVKYFNGPPSILYSLAAIGLEQGIELQNKPEFVFYGAENMQEYQRRVIEKFTGAPISDQYGAAEGVANISRCEHFKYHEDFEFGVIEYVNPFTDHDGRTSHELICTGLSNRAFPLIRYKIGDRAVVMDKNEPPCPCGRESRRIDSIIGRVEDYITTPEGHKIMALPVIYSKLSTIKEVQALQYDPGELLLKMVVRDNYSVRDEEFLKRQFKELISPTLKLKIEYVSEIEREKNGKFRVIKSYIPKNENKTI